MNKNLIEYIDNNKFYITEKVVNGKNNIFLHKKVNNEIITRFIDIDEIYQLIDDCNESILTFLVKSNKQYSNSKYLFIKYKYNSITGCTIFIDQFLGNSIEKMNDTNNLFLVRNDSENYIYNLKDNTFILNDNEKGFVKKLYNL